MQALNNLLKGVDSSWINILKNALSALDTEYIEFLLKNEDYFPDIDNFLNAFKTLSLENTKYILFGQDPYPRYESAIGYAFIDAKVKDIFSCKGLSKEINRATSLRNFIKMLLLCDGLLDSRNLSQEAISKLDKTFLCKDIFQLKDNFEKNGVLLLNMALIFTDKKKSKYHLQKWKPFIESLLKSLKDANIDFILFGKAANEINKLKYSEFYIKYNFVHPYNISFISNKKVHELFKPMKLLRR